MVMLILYRRILRKVPYSTLTQASPVFVLSWKLTGSEVFSTKITVLCLNMTPVVIIISKGPLEKEGMTMMSPCLEAMTLVKLWPDIEQEIVSGKWTGKNMLGEQLDDTDGSLQHKSLGTHSTLSSWT